MSKEQTNPTCHTVTVMTGVEKTGNENSTDSHFSQHQQQPENSSFPYTGIFSSGGFLSTINDEILDKQNSYRGNSPTSLTAAGQCQDPDQKPFSENHNNDNEEAVTRKENSVEETEVLPIEAAFAIDHILDKILHSVDKSDLLTCRLVSHRWLSFATEELRHVVRITFVKDCLCNQNGIKNEELKLKDFNLMLKQNIDNFPSGFPCHTFHFVSDSSYPIPVPAGSLNCHDVQNFLNIYGVNIRKLKFDGIFHYQNENKTVEMIRELIMEQTPNLRSLELLVTPYYGQDPLELTNDKSVNSMEVRREGTGLVNSSLKMLEIVGLTSKKMMDMIMSSSPNLTEIRTHREAYQYFTKPSNKIHLLKRLIIDTFNSNMIDAVEKIALASLEIPGNLKIRDICVHHWDWLWEQCQSGGGEFINSELIRRFIFVFNRVFECSWDTLESIEWSGVVFFNGMRWPKVMPKVTTINFETLTDLFKGSSEASTKIFPPGFNLATTFPKLKTIHFDDQDGQENFVEFLKQLNSVKAPVFSVKQVYITTYNDDETSMEAMDLLEKYFPFAQIYDF